MTPAPQPLPVPDRGLARDALRAGLSMVLLAALFLPARNPITHGLDVEWRPSLELAGLFVLVAMAALARPRWVAGRGFAFGLALLVVAAALLNLVDAASPTLLGRDLNLYWDLGHLPSLFGLASGSAGLWWVSAAVVVSVVILALGIAGVYWLWRQVLGAMVDRRIAAGVAILFGLSLDISAFVPEEQRPLASELGREIVHHATVIESVWRLYSRPDAPLPSVLATSGPPLSNLAGLKRQDVYLIYIESYGTTVFETPEFQSALRQPLEEFATTLRKAGYTLASSRLVSPTFGGGSWLAHATLASGIRLDDPVLYSQLLVSGRKLLPGYFKDAGWRAIDIAPGMKEPSEEAARAWGFDREVYAAELGYHGPAFGWFTIPDQFTLNRANAIRAALGSKQPVLTQIVLVSSHIPFSPVPPYLADWSDAGAFATVPAAAWDDIYRPPEWTALGRAYIESLKYDFLVLGDWLANQLPGDALVILLGDHQPPAVVGGASQRWTVPIHVLSRDPELIGPFLEAGYVAGIIPGQTAPARGMEKFLPDFLAEFGRTR